MKITNKVLLCLSLISIILCSCRSDNTEQIDNANQVQESVQDSTHSYDSDTFETSKGKKSLEKAKSDMYNEGVSNASFVKQLNGRNPLHYGSYEYAKEWFGSFYGLPKDENAKNAMEESIKAYQKGYQDGINF